jgi:EAL domain-containing protein (putative c-di-GMP-specific phosphodiesterase class I)
MDTPAAMPSTILGQLQSARGLAAQRVQGRLTLSRAVQRYQPQVDLQSGRIAGAETLLCVPGPRRLEPATALRADIDASGLSIAWFEYQVRHACRAKSAWLQAFPHEFPLAIPVPASVFQSGLVLPIVQHNLRQAGIAAGLIELQVDVAVSVASPNVMRLLTGLHNAGLGIALHAASVAPLTLRLLAMTPLTKLRLDALPLLRSADDRAQWRVFAGLMGVARGLGLQVCTVGVDSAPLLAAVARQVRSLTQGEYIGAALDPTAFLQRLRDLNETTATLPCLDDAAAADAELTQPRATDAASNDPQRQTGRCAQG